MTDPRLPDERGLIDELNDLEVVTQAQSDYASVQSYQSAQQARLQTLHHYYAPDNGIHITDDRFERPNKINLTVNYCKAAVDVDARLQGLVPRLAAEPNGIDPKARKDAEVAEAIMRRFLDLSGFDVWWADFCKIGCLYGLSWLKPFWNKAENRPDVVVIENTGMVRAGWGSSDFSVLDWVIAEYTLSPLEIMRRYPDITVHPDTGHTPPYRITKDIGSHDDPLGQVVFDGTRPQLIRRPVPYQPSEYEEKQIPVWDYWFKDGNSDIWNAIIVGRSTVAMMSRHPEMPDIPYIPVENDHEPGVPWGIATHEPLIDINVELDRLMSHGLQLIADEVDPAWQLTGENADSVPDGIVPKGGHIVPAGTGNEIKPIPKSVNMPVIQQMISELKEQFHDVSGLPRILFGQSPGSQTTGRALAVQVEAAANRLDFKRRRKYMGLRALLNFWAFMLEKRNPRAGSLQLGRAVKGFRRWKIIAPEITPKDVIEATTNEINKIQAKVVSLKTARDALGIDSPEDEEALIIEERGNVDLFPADVQIKTAVIQMIMAIQQQMAATGQQNPMGNLANQEQQAQPTLGQSQNDGATQPATLEGGPPPGNGGEAPTVSTQLIRPNAQTGQSQALNQLAVSRRIA